MLRFSGGNARPSTPETMLYVMPDRPVPISTPAVSTNSQGEDANVIVTSPSTYRREPATTTLADP
jgi:hypothetical protein